MVKRRSFLKVGAGVGAGVVSTSLVSSVAFAESYSPGYGEVGSSVKTIHDVPASVWREVGRTAGAHGDDEGREVASVMVRSANVGIVAAAHASNLGSVDQGAVRADPMNVVTTLAKQALIKLLRYAA